VAAVLLAVLPVSLAAQQPAVITGHVTNAAGAPLSGAQVTVSSLGIGATSRGDGSYTVLVPAARIPTGPVTVTARLIGYKLGSTQVTLEGGSATADFALADNPLQLGEVVVTGAGTSSKVEKLGTVRNYIDSTAIVNSHEQNLVNALAAKAPNIIVNSASGDAGAPSYIQIRGLTSLQASDGQPLFVVDGVPVDNSDNFSNQQTLNGGTTPPNRLIDINPDDIENIEVLKGASSGAIYGSRAGQGVVLITTKHGRPGETKYSLRSSWSIDEHTQLPALQSEYGQGTPGNPAVCGGPGCVLTGLSWQTTPLAAGTPVFNHEDEIFQQGYTTDNSLQISGGSDRTTFFLSGGYSYDRGFVVGDNNHYRRISVRFNGSQQVTNNLKVGANVGYTDGYGGFLQGRNDTGGLLLGAWRTTPTFNNLPYLDPITQTQRSYRYPEPIFGDATTGPRVYDNPFFVANAQPATSQVGRAIGGINGEWAPTSWLKFNENLGLDYGNDERTEAFAQSNSQGGISGILGVGGVNGGYLRNTQVDQTLTGTISYKASESFKGTITVGQNLNSQTFQTRQALGTGLIAATPFNLTNTSAISLPVADQKTTLRLESYFAQATADIADRLFLTAAARNDGASSFGASSLHSWYPKASASWLFYKPEQGSGKGFVTYGKLRAAYGQSGTQPAPYLLGNTYIATLIGDGTWGSFTSTTEGGAAGYVSGANINVTNLGPERVKELEAGVDVGLFGDKADLSVTHYRDNSDGVILNLPIPTSTGFSEQITNAASLQNRGWEVSLNLRPVTTKGFAWDVGLQWARNRGLTTGLAQGVTFAPLLNQASGSATLNAVAIVGQPIGVFYGTDFVRCGNGVILGGGDNIDNTPGECQGAPKGALYIDASGYPQKDANNLYVLGDPNPSWTGSVRTTFRFGKLSLGGLLDIRHGGISWNGTQGALSDRGTSLISAQYRDAINAGGGTVIFGQTAIPAAGVLGGPVAGPGAGMAVPLDFTWFNLGGGSGFNGPDAAYMQDGGYVKIRELSLAYTIDQPWVSRSLGFRSIELRVAGRNLTSWNNYTGVDPEHSIAGTLSPTQAYDWFDNPQSRSWVFSLTLNR
jgi:TonB-linked SusC/RagA family outer membrane protein